MRQYPIHSSFSSCRFLERQPLHDLLGFSAKGIIALSNMACGHSPLRRRKCLSTQSSCGDYTDEKNKAILHKLSWQIGNCWNIPPTGVQLFAYRLTAIRLQAYSWCSCRLPKNLARDTILMWHHAWGSVFFGFLFFRKKLLDLRFLSLAVKAVGIEVKPFKIKTSRYI